MIKIPDVSDLIGEARCQLRHASCLIDINQKTTLYVAQGSAADILIDRQMQHPVDQAFAQRAAGKGHTLDVELGENGDQNGQPAREDQRAFQRQAFNFQFFQAPALDGALF